MELQIYYYESLLSLKIRPNFYASKIWSHMVLVLYLTIWLQILVVENFCNYAVITKILFMKFLSQLIILDAISTG